MGVWMYGSGQLHLALHAEWRDLADAVVDEGAESGGGLGVALPCGRVCSESFELVVEHHSSQRVKCCHTSFAVSKLEQLTRLVQLSGKGHEVEVCRFVVRVEEGIGRRWWSGFAGRGSVGDLVRFETTAKTGQREEGDAETTGGGRSRDDAGRFEEREREATDAEERGSSIGGRACFGSEMR